MTFSAETLPFSIERCPGNPIITPASHADIGSNINGPSVIRVPAWLPHRLADYYCYFAHHQGQWIRLALADHPEGPWRVVDQRPLSVKDITGWGGHGHVASPELLIDENNHRLLMFFHAPHRRWKDDHATSTPHLLTINPQATGLAISDDGLSFKTQNQQVISFPYLRIWNIDEQFYGISTRGLLFKRPQAGFPDGTMAWIERQTGLADEGRRHAAVHRRGDRLYYFFSDKGDRPERIKMTVIDLRPDWSQWQAGQPIEVLRPELAWEGSELPLAASTGGKIDHRVNQLRDPCYLQDENNPDRGWLYYTVAGESGIAVARITWRR